MNGFEHDEEQPLQRSVARTIIDMCDDSDEPKIYSTPAGKAPRGWVADEEEEDEEILEAAKHAQENLNKVLQCDENYEDIVPDLGVYFSKFDLSEQQQIAMCRTYANYLTQKLRASGAIGGPRKKIKVLPVKK